MFLSNIEKILSLIFDIITKDVKLVLILALIIGIAWVSYLYVDETRHKNIEVYKEKRACDSVVLILKSSLYEIEKSYNDSLNSIRIENKNEIVLYYKKLLRMTDKLNQQQIEILNEK